MQGSVMYILCNISDIVKPVYSGHLGENDWLQSFLKRHNIVFRTLSGESGDVNVTIVSEWKSKLPNLIKDYHPRDIYNMDETNLSP
jgi:hypothetical protein